MNYLGRIDNPVSNPNGKQVNTIADLSSVTSNDISLPPGTLTILVPALAGDWDLQIPEAINAPGTQYTFLVTATLGHSLTISSAGGTNDINAIALDHTACVAHNGVARDSVILGATCVAGDQVNFVSDGALWHCRSISRVNGNSITYA